MDDVELLEVLLELARGAEFQIRPEGRLLPDDPPLASGVCRLRGQLYVVLSASESVAMQIETLATALRDNAEAFLERQHLPPAVRTILDPEGAKTFGSA